MCPFIIRIAFFLHINQQNEQKGGIDQLKGNLGKNQPNDVFVNVLVSLKNHETKLLVKIQQKFNSNNDLNNLHFN